MTEAAVIDIDIGKKSFHLVGVDGSGAIQCEKKFSRTQLMRHMHRCLHAWSVWKRAVVRIIWRESCRHRDTTSD